MPPSPRSSTASKAEEETHSRIGPSGSSRWLKCRASVGFIEKNQHRLPANSSSEAADEGTKAHELAKLMLLGKKWREEDYDDEMVTHVTGYVKFVQTQVGMLSGSKLHVEQRVPLYYDGTQKGTADVVILSDNTAFVIDLKYGEGVSVEAVKNSQLAIYLASWLKAKAVKLHHSVRVTLIIYQPRARDGRFVRRWEITMREFSEFASEIQGVALDIVMDPDNQPFYADPDTVCRWCRAKAICPHYAELLFQDAPKEVAVIDQPNPKMVKPESLTSAQVAKVIRYAPDLKKWLDDVVEYAAKCAEGGEPIPDTKFVAGRGSRDWSDEEAAFKVLKRHIHREELHVTKLLSPAQAEARLKKPDLRRPVTTRLKNRLSELIVKSEGNKLLVHVTDDHPALDGTLSLEDRDLL